MREGEGRRERRRERRRKRRSGRRREIYTPAERRREIYTPAERDIHPCGMPSLIFVYLSSLWAIAFF